MCLTSTPWNLPRTSNKPRKEAGDVPCCCDIAPYGAVTSVTRGCRMSRVRAVAKVRPLWTSKDSIQQPRQPHLSQTHGQRLGVIDTRHRRAELQVIYNPHQQPTTTTTTTGAPWVRKNTTSGGDDPGGALTLYNNN